MRPAVSTITRPGSIVGSRAASDHRESDGGRDRQRRCVLERPRLRRLAWTGAETNLDGSTILGSISKRGNRYLRALFVQASWVVLDKLGPKHWQRYGLKSWI